MVDAMRRKARRAPGLLALALCLALTACKTELYSDVSQRDANAMVAILLKNGIPAERTAIKGGGYSVHVEETLFAQAVDALNAEGYPRQEFQSFSDIFPAEGLISSPTEERARYVFALSQELSKTISDIAGVMWARVHIVLPENDPLRQEFTPSSASVVIEHDRSVAIEQLIPQIKMLVSNGIEGLTYDKVSVALLPVLVERGGAAASSVAMSSFLGITMPAASVARARLLFGGLALCLIAIAAIAAFVYWRNSDRDETLQGRPLPPAPAE